MRQLLVALLICFCGHALAQTPREIATLVNTPRNSASLPAEYYMLIAPENEQEAFDSTFRRQTPNDVLTRQKEKLTERNKVTLLRCEQCALPFVQLDTAANIKFKRNLYGYWRAVVIRTIRFSDSISYSTDLFYRNAVVQFEDTSDLIISISEDNFRVYYKDAGKDRYRIITDSKYEFAGKRFLLTYKNLKSEADVMQAGIDKEGRLIINNNTAYQRREEGHSNVYATNTTQLILEKLNVQQLHYNEEKKNNPVPSRRVSPN